MRVIESAGLSRKRVNLGILALAIVAITTTIFWLAASDGILALPQAAVPAGAGAGGKIVTFTALIPSTMTVPQGQGAQLIDGILLGKFAVAAGFSDQLRVDVAWLDPQRAGAVLNNPNAWITFALNYPIHTGVCTNSDAANSVAITDNVALCVARNTQASGPLNNNGTLAVTKDLLGSYIMGNMADPSTPSTCGATGSTWCAPSGTALNQNIFYITASITTPGGVPPSSQIQVAGLNFYIGAKAK